MIRTPADWITAARFVLSIILYIILGYILFDEPEGGNANGILKWAAYIIFVIAALTDLVDGAVARRTGMSDFGRVADPFVDKVLIVGTLVFLVTVPEIRKTIPTWSVVLIVAREFLVTGVRGYVESKGMKLPADAWGKSKMILQCLGAGGGLLLLTHANKTSPCSTPWLHDFFVNWVPLLTAIVWWSAVVITFYSGVGYFLRASKYLSTPHGGGS
ncbi:MAG: CDP-diacylglycerol--glycerol-3-phosphate 3-phosphatidyltransferase [Planctomycetes bacterium]|nr:CDP-diacylglycerol--glycerol-3-phosphate 3-phosphatidyltransferase [Planctomycetota bacterium]